MAPFLQVTSGQLCQALDRTAIVLDDGSCPFPGNRSPLRVIEELAHTLGQLIRIADLVCGTPCQQQTTDFFDVKHVWPKEQRQAEGSRLEGVVATGRH